VDAAALKSMKAKKQLTPKALASFIEQMYGLAANNVEAFPAKALCVELLTKALGIIVVLSEAKNL
jgi:hypothetical protein